MNYIVDANRLNVMSHIFPIIEGRGTASWSHDALKGSQATKHPWTFSACAVQPPEQKYFYIRGVAMKFPERLYCKPHTCMLTAYWEGSPSKYSPWAAMHLVQRRCLPLLETVSELLLGNSFQCHRHVCLMSSLSWNISPLKADFTFGNGQKSFGAKSGEQGGCSISVIDFWAREHLVSWSIVMVKNPIMDQSSGLFLRM